MCLWTGADVGHPQHLQHGRDVGVAAVPLDSVRHVEDHAGTLPGYDPGHEVPELIGHVDVSLYDFDVVPALFQSGRYLLDRLRIVPLLRLRAEEVDDVRGRGFLFVEDDGYFHNLPLVWP